MNRYQNFNFDMWMELAKSDPEKFELVRQAAVERLISHSRNDMSRQRMRALEKKIEALRNAEVNPSCTAANILSLMNIQLDNQLNAMVERLKDLLAKE